jgi:hypothetical protein
MLFMAIVLTAICFGVRFYAYLDPSMAVMIAVVSGLRHAWL